MGASHDSATALDEIFHAVLQASWQGAIAIVLVLLVRRVLGARVPARWPYLLWFLVLARLLVPTGALPHSPASLENIPAVARPFEHPPTFLPPVAPPPSLLGGADSPRPVPPAVAKNAPQPVASSVPGRSAGSWWTWAARVWLGGVCLLVGWLAVCVVGLRRRLHLGTFPVEDEILAAWRVCCRRWLRQAPPLLRAADWVDSPALVGWCRPTLLVPRRTLDAFSTRDWEHVFAHEIAHLRWRDHWAQLLLLAAGCVHWFNPLVWLGLRRLRADRELAADEWALRRLQGGRALAYGETLFKTVAHRPAHAAFQPGIVGLSEDGAQMKERLRRITAFLPGRRLVSSLVGLAAVLALGTVVLGQGSPVPSTPPVKEAADTPVVPSVESVAAEARGFTDALLAAARAGDAAELTRLIDSSFTPPPTKFSERAATALLDDLVRRRELTAFVTLHDQLKPTSYGRDWQPGDELLASLVKDGRTDFLDALLARRLDPDRLKTLVATADKPTADWITHRVAEVGRQRDNLDALQRAAEDNDLPAMGRLLGEGAEVNGVGPDDNTPLLHAVFRDRLEAAQWLLDHGAQVDKARHSTYTPLCLANSVPMAELLRKNGANVHAQLAKDVSILTYVARFADSAVVEWFLQQGLDPKMIGNDGETLLFGLRDGRTAERLLGVGVDPNHLDKRGETALFSARSAEVVRALVAHGAKVSDFKEPLLPRLAQAGSATALEAVIQVGADHDPATLQQALLGAVFVDDGEAVKTLVAHGAKPNEPSADGPGEDNKMWPLTPCTMEGQTNAAKALLEAGADPNGGVKPGWLLINAMLNGQKEVAKLLHDAGARNVSDLAYAVFLRDAAKVKALLASAPAYSENPAFWDYVLPSAALSGDVDTTHAALAKGAPARPDENDDSYALAAFGGQDEALAVLLAARRHGDDPEALREALKEAVYGSHPDKRQPAAEHFVRCVRMLLDAGAPVSGGKVPLLQSAAFTRYPGGNPTVIEMLARAGADLNPVVGTEKNPNARLVEVAREACAQGHCSVAVAETLVKLNRVAPPVATPTPPKPGTAEAPSPALHKHLVNEGHVSMADGSPLAPDPITAYTHYEAASSSGGGSGAVYGGVFSFNLSSASPRDAVKVSAAVAQRGCAVAFAGPLTLENLDKLGRLDIKLTRGYTASVEIVDESGKPIGGALVRPYYPGPPTVELADVRTDAAGRATFEHLGEAPLNLRVLADGFQADEATGLHLDPAKPYQWTLRPTLPMHGMVTDTAGQPVAGAVVKLAGVRGPHNETHFEPELAPVLTNADTRGHFTLASLRPDSRYFFFVEARGYSGAYLREVELAPGEMNVVLGPELLIRGRLVHPPDSVVHQGVVHLQYSQSFDFGDNFSGVASENVDVRPVNGEANFVVGPFYRVSGGSALSKNAPDWERKTVGLHIDSWGRADFSIDELPISNFVFDLARKTDDRAAPEPNAEPEPANARRGDVPTKQASPAALPAPTAADQMAPVPDAGAIILHRGHLADSVTPLQFGEILGTVSAAADGQPISEAKVRLVGKMGLVAPNHYGLRTAANDSAATDARGQFALHGLPPAAIYWLCVEASGYGAAYVAVDQATSDAIRVKLGPVHLIRGRIIHAPESMIHDGKLSLSFSQSLDEGSPDRQAWTAVTLEPTDGVADFVAGPFSLPQGPHPFSKAPVTLRVDGEDKAYFRGEDLPGAGYVLDLAPDLGQLAGEYKTAADSPWTLDLRSDGTAFYYTHGGTRYTARYSLKGEIVTVTFPDGLQEHLQVDGSQLLGTSKNQALPTFERLKHVDGAP